MKRTQQKKWTFFPENPRRESALAQELNIPTILAKFLLNRSISDPKSARDYLQPELGQLVDPFRFKQMNNAVARIQRALDKREKILIHGDYDVDGVSGTVLLIQLFRMLGANVTFHIPNRLRDGYSFGQASLEKIRREKASLVITIDNGITALGPISQLQNEGIDVIITDHHRPSESDPLPPAVAILNPNLSDSGYPHGSLCGVAVAFKLAWGVAQSLSSTRRASPEMKQFLLDAMGWVAIGTITDIVPLLGENRVFAKFGLVALQKSTRPGVKALLSTSGLSGKKLSSEDIAFRIGPRINAAGRMGEAEKAVELLTTNSPEQAQTLAAELETRNDERRQIERQIFQEARSIVQKQWNFKKHPVIVLASPNWHAGIVGIVCSKLLEEFHAPTILIALEGDRGRGSARAMDGFAMHEALSHCSQVLEKFGGHAQAAGLEIQSRRVEEFREKLNEIVRLKMAPKGWPTPTLPIDAEISLLHLTRPFLREVDRLAPFGKGNEVPIFATKKLKLAGVPRRVGKHEEHLQFHVQQGETIFKSIAFWMGERAEEIERADSLTLAYTPKINSWGGRNSVQLEIQDISIEE